MVWHHPILSCSESKQFEDGLFAGDSQKAALAMERAGRSLGSALYRDLGVRFSEPSPSCLLLVGKGHNAGDAIIAVVELMEHIPSLAVTVYPVLGIEGMSPLIQSWWIQLISKPNVQVLSSLNDLIQLKNHRITLSVDGIFGMQCRQPLPQIVIDIRSVMELLEIGVRVAVDLPSGVVDDLAENALRADFTYATGIFKTPLTVEANLRNVGRIRYLDIGFFDNHNTSSPVRIVSPRILEKRRLLRNVETDKRHYGHLLIIAGSRRMPGALLMAVKSAIRSGVGLITVVAPESVVAQLAPWVPEAMWIPWPETPTGGLALEGVGNLLALQHRVSAVLMGPGCGTEAETQALLDEVTEVFDTPLVLDADALTRSRINLIKDRKTPVVLTPHFGEFHRISGCSKVASITDKTLLEFTSEFAHGLVVLKGPITRMCSEQQVFYFPMGNPILARGGSGDILSGLVGGKVANSKENTLLESVALAVSLHGNAADRLFSQKEETHVQTTDILNHLNLY